jgi:hypothetical protein
MKQSEQNQKNMKKKEKIWYRSVIAILHCNLALYYMVQHSVFIGKIGLWMFQFEKEHMGKLDLYPFIAQKKMVFCTDGFCWRCWTRSLQDALGGSKHQNLRSRCPLERLKTATKLLTLAGTLISPLSI